MQCRQFALGSLGRLSVVCGRMHGFFVFYILEAIPLPLGAAYAPLCHLPPSYNIWVFFYFLRLYFRVPCRAVEPEGQRSQKVAWGSCPDIQSVVRVYMRVLNRSYIPRSRSLSTCLLLQVRPSHLRRPHICAPVSEVLNIHRVHPLPAGRSFPSCGTARHFRSLPTSRAQPQGPAELPALHPQVYERRRHRPSMPAASPVLHTAL